VRNSGVQFGDIQPVWLGDGGGCVGHRLIIRR
jgi:hypothetical protein